MTNYVRRGKFIVVDGPNGVGKTTICNNLADILMRLGYDVLVTKEPTSFETGRIAKFLEEYGDPLSLACGVAADRYYHISKIIIPALKEGKIVISHRYLPSSLVLQRIDGINIEFILSINSEIIRQDVTFILLASPRTLLERLSKRESLSRYERLGAYGIKLEVKYYKEAVEILNRLGWKVYTINNESNLQSTIEKIVNILKREGII